MFFPCKTRSFLEISLVKLNRPKRYYVVKSVCFLYYYLQNSEPFLKATRKHVVDGRTLITQNGILPLSVELECQSPFQGGESHNFFGFLLMLVKRLVGKNPAPNAT